MRESFGLACDNRPKIMDPPLFQGRIRDILALGFFYCVCCMVVLFLYNLTDLFEVSDWMGPPAPVGGLHPSRADNRHLLCVWHKT